MEARARALLLILPLLLAAAATALVAEGWAAPRRANRSESFSHLVGGPVELDSFLDDEAYHRRYTGSDLLDFPWPSVPATGPRTGEGSDDALQP